VRAQCFQLIPGVYTIGGRGQSRIIVGIAGETVGCNLVGIGITVAVGVISIDQVYCQGISAGIFVGCTICVDGIFNLAGPIIPVGLMAPLAAAQFYGLAFGIDIRPTAVAKIAVVQLGASFVRVGLQKLVCVPLAFVMVGGIYRGGRAAMIRSTNH
jgi:hypothetical protein